MHYSNFTGVIFDIDDTLLDNMPRDPVRRLHERARLTAVHEIGRRQKNEALQQLTAQQNLEAFLTAPVHTLESAVWNILANCGQVPRDPFDPGHPLLKEIVHRKNELYETLLREEGKEVPGATGFVRALAANGFTDKMAVASTAERRDIDIFLEKVGLGQLFPHQRIISKSNVTHAKPHPEAFELAFRSLGLPKAAKSQVLVFEDDPRGIMAAKAAGMPVFAITTAHDRENLAKLEIAPDAIADSYAEFAKLLGLPVH